MDRDSMETEQPVAKPTPSKSSVLPTEHFHVELSLSFVGRDGPKLYQLSIEAPTLKDAHGIFLGGSARIFDIASQDP